MIMPHLNYREMTRADFATWPEWVATVNAAQRYCDALPKHRVREYRFKCSPSSLPSFHPYWRMITHRSSIGYAARHAMNLRKIEADPTLLPILYNNSTRIEEVRARAKKIRRQCW